MRFLFATDGSPGAAAALDKLIATFDPRDAAVDLLTVVDDRAPGEVETAVADAQRVARARLEHRGFRVETVIRDGHPADEIVSFAAERTADLVVLGARPSDDGRPGFTGSVASKVARYASSPVLVARDARPVRAVVLGYDGSPDAEAALALLARLRYCDRPRVEVRTVYEVARPFSSGIAPMLHARVWAAEHEEVDTARRAAEAMAGDASVRLRRAGLAAIGGASEGRAADRLIAAAREAGADLIAVGSRGLSGIERFVLGSTSGELVATVPTSLLVARS